MPRELETFKTYREKNLMVFLETNNIKIHIRNIIDKAKHKMGHY